LFRSKREKHHGTEILEEGIGQSRTRDEEAQGRHIEERQIGQEGQESKAGDRDRSVGGEARGKESPSEEEFEQEEERQETVRAQVQAITLALGVVEAAWSGHPHLASVS
jgi:hypothetical protein